MKAFAAADERDPTLEGLFKGSHQSYEQDRDALLSSLEAAAVRAAQRRQQARVHSREKHANGPATDADFNAFKEGQTSVTESAKRAV